MNAIKTLILFCMFLGSLLQLETANASYSKTYYGGDGWSIRFSNYHPTKQVITVSGVISASAGELEEASQVFAGIDPRKELIVDVSYHLGGRIARAEELVNLIRTTCESKRNKNDPSQSCNITSYISTSSGDFPFCVSACLIPFMAGKKRLACTDAVIGFHSAGINLAGLSLNATEGYNMSMRLSLGVFKSWLVKNASILNSATVTLLTLQQMEGSNIVTDIDEKCDYVNDANEWRE